MGEGRVRENLIDKNKLQFNVKGDYWKTVRPGAFRRGAPGRVPGTGGHQLKQAGVEYPRAGHDGYTSYDSARNAGE